MSYFQNLFYFKGLQQIPGIVGHFTCLCVIAMNFSALITYHSFGFFSERAIA